MPVNKKKHSTESGYVSIISLLESYFISYGMIKLGQIMVCPFFGGTLFWQTQVQYPIDHFQPYCAYPFSGQGVMSNNQPHASVGSHNEIQVSVN